MNYINRITQRCGQLVAWLPIVIAGMMTFDVVARYLFNSPTIWASELSLACQIWATYLGTAFIIQNRGLIRIDLLTHYFGPGFRKFSDLLTLSIILVFSGVACYYGSQTVLESIRLNRTESSMLSLPLWVTEIALPVGFGLVILQCIAEILQIITAKEPSASDEKGATKGGAGR